MGSFPSSEAPKRNCKSLINRLWFLPCSRLPIRAEDKVKYWMAWIQEIYSEPYESVIPAIETLHFTSSWAPVSITFLGRNQFRPLGL